MQTRNDRSRTTGVTPEKHGDLIHQRMAKLGLDWGAIERGESETLAKIRQRCLSCSFWEACAVDLKRDPNSPVWEAYCPNSAVLNAFTAVAEALGRQPAI